MWRAWTFLGIVAVTIIIGTYEAERIYDRRKAELDEMKAQIALEEQQIHMLKVEWSYLTQPERLLLLAREHLQLGPTSVEQFSTDFQGLEERVTAENGDMLRVSAPATDVKGDVR